jgi:hypothetical protein
MNIKALPFLCLLAVSTMATPVLSQEAVDIGKIPTINNTDWRTPKFQAPWSVPVLINDEFDGSYLTVFDKNFQRNIFTGEENGLISNWSRKTLRVFAYVQTPCNGWFCTPPTVVQETSHITIKTGGKVYRLVGNKGNYDLSEEIAYALKTAPLEEIRIKVEFASSGVPVVSAIGRGTVASWKTVYQDAKLSDQAANHQSKISPPQAKQKRAKSR